MFKWQLYNSIRNYKGTLAGFFVGLKEQPNKSYTKPYKMPLYQEYKTEKPLIKVPEHQ